MNEPPNATHNTTNKQTHHVENDHEHERHAHIRRQANRPPPADARNAKKHKQNAIKQSSNWKQTNVLCWIIRKPYAVQHVFRQKRPNNINAITDECWEKEHKSIKFSLICSAVSWWWSWIWVGMRAKRLWLHFLQRTRESASYQHKWKWNQASASNLALTTASPLRANKYLQRTANAPKCWLNTKYNSILWVKKSVQVWILHCQSRRATGRKVGFWNQLVLSCLFGPKSVVERRWNCW